MVEGYGKGIKYALLIANSIIFVCGTMLLAMGIWTISDRSVMERLLGISIYLASAILLIITGCIVSIIAFVGALGAYQEVQCMLKTYFVILLGLSIIISTVGGIGFTFRDQLDNRLQKELQDSMKLYGVDSKISDAWDTLQMNFHCCGVSYPRTSRGADSWRRESTKFNGTDGPVVPESCCKSLEDDPIRKGCQSRQPRKDDTWTEGCYEKIKTTIKNHSLAIGLSAILAVLFIIFGLILSGTLFLIIRREQSSSQQMAKLPVIAGLEE